ncbi:MAG TPA: tetratricopeptide repeat protein [Gemmatimonadales bacterium]|nr:tetratricopeptide repeat protein [Gemmatimonadales bacterium]
MAYTSEIEKLERRWAENPKGRNFAPLADAYRKAGELDRAIELCQNGLDLHPDYVSAHIVYGRCLIDMKNDTGAKDVFQKVLALDPENIIALKILGEIAERNNRFDEAVDWLGRLLNADPMNGDAAEALARAKTKAASAPKPPAIADAETAPLAKPDFEVEHETPESVAPLEAAPSRSPDVETFEGGLDFNAAAHAAAKAEGLEVQEDVELNSQQFEQVDVIGLSRTQYEGSGMFKLDTPEPADAPTPLPELTDDAMPQVDLPLIMPDDMPAAEAPPPAPAPRRPPPPPQPPPPPPPREAAVPAAVALSDDDGAADTATLSQAEPVLTETMAELYLKQGHQQDALRVYQALLAQRPKDAKLRRRVEELTGGGGARRGGSGVSAQAFLKGIWSGRGSAPAPRAPAPRAPAPPPEPDLAPAALQSTLEAAFDGADSVMSAPGEPSHPAQDHISLDSVFGDDSARRSTSVPAAGDGASATPPAGGGGPSGGSAPAAAGGAAPFSFDDFFGGAGSGSAAGAAAAPAGAGGGEGAAPVEPGSARTPGRSSGRAQRPPEDEADADQFQQWLKKLKS